MLTNARLKVWITLLVSLVLGGAAYLYHRQQHPGWLMLDGVATGMSFAMVTLSAGTVWLFLDGVSHFKSELQKSYRLLCIGIAFFGLAQLQYGLIVVLGWGFWVSSGLITVPYLLFAAFMFMAMRKFAALLDIHGLATSFRLATCVALVLATVFVLLPHAAKPDMLAYAVTAGLAIWDAVFVAFTANLAKRIKDALGEAYARPMTRLCLSLTVVALAGLHFAIIEMLMNDGDWYYDASITFMPFFGSSLLLLWAGYDMTVINSVPVYQVPAKGLTDTTDAPLVDIIVYVASLASIPSEIDDMLDPLRGVTATLSADRVLTAQAKDTLRHVYGQLEIYLTSKERLRSFSIQELRALITRKYGLSETAAKSIWGPRP